MRKYRQRTCNHFFAFVAFFYTTPNAVSSIIHWASMKLNIRRIAEVKVCYTLIGSDYLMIDTALEYAQPAEHEISLLRVAW